MARGKHKASATNKKQLALKAQLEQLTQELASEREALQEADRVLLEVDRLNHELNKQQSLLNEQVAPFVSTLEAERDFLRKVLDAESVIRAELDDSWHRYGEQAMDASEGKTGLERMEAYMSRLGGSGVIVNADSSNLKSGYAHTLIQRARGERTSIPLSGEKKSPYLDLYLLLTEWAKFPNLLPSELRTELLADESIFKVNESGQYLAPDDESLSAKSKTLLTKAQEISHKVLNTKLSDFTEHELAVWGTGVCVRDEYVESDTTTNLGLTEPAKPVERPRGTDISIPVQLDELVADDQPQSILLPLSFDDLDEQPKKLSVDIPMPLHSLTAGTRVALASSDPSDVLRKWSGILKNQATTINSLGYSTGVYSSPEMHPQPGQGYALQHKYSAAAFARWLEHPADTRTGEIAVGVTAGANYWLPGGQTTAFADSEPLSASDYADILLPFPQVFLSFAEPLRLDGVSDEEVSKKVRTLSELAKAANGADMTLHKALQVPRVDTRISQSMLTLDEAISKWGASIEGMVLLGDSVGRPSDLFGWCVAIPGEYGTTLGRFVLPALRSKTSYRSVVDNLTAVVAWGQWHDPDKDTSIPLGLDLEDLRDLISDKEFQRNARRAGLGIHVVDVGRTMNRSSKHDGESLGSVSPHFRRAHWRRQRYGERNSQVKRVRIDTVLVNAQRADLEPRVYRLRLNK